jgi:hypothetical protein
VVRDPLLRRAKPPKTANSTLNQNSSPPAGITATSPERSQGPLCERWSAGKPHGGLLPRGLLCAARVVAGKWMPPLARARVLVAKAGARRRQTEFRYSSGRFPSRGCPLARLRVLVGKDRPSRGVSLRACARAYWSGNSRCPYGIPADTLGERPAPDVALGGQGGHCSGRLSFGGGGHLG